jgi:hypothetical protein
MAIRVTSYEGGVVYEVDTVDEAIALDRLLSLQRAERDVAWMQGKTLVFTKEDVWIEQT